MALTWRAHLASLAPPISGLRAEVAVHGPAPGGFAAHLTIQSGAPVRRNAVAKLQKQLVKQRGIITFFHDLPFNHPRFAARQWVGAKGFPKGDHAKPDEALSAEETQARVARVTEGANPPVAPAAQRAGDLAFALYHALAPK